MVDERESKKSITQQRCSTYTDKKGIRSMRFRRQSALPAFCAALPLQRPPSLLQAVLVSFQTVLPVSFAVPLPLRQVLAPVNHQLAWTRLRHRKGHTGPLAFGAGASTRGIPKRAARFLRCSSSASTGSEEVEGAGSAGGAAGVAAGGGDCSGSGSGSGSASTSTTVSLQYMFDEQRNNNARTWPTVHK